MNKIKKMFGFEWERIDYMPKWIKFPKMDPNFGGNFVFYAKGKHNIYKIKVFNWKGGNQEEKVWKRLRKV